MQINKDKIRELLLDYDIDNENISLYKFPQGVINDNFLISLKQQKFVLKIYNFKKQKDILIDLKVMQQLNKVNFPCPGIIKNQEDKLINLINKKPAVLYNYLPGKHIESQKIKPKHVRQIGKYLAKLHKNLRNQKLTHLRCGWNIKSLRSLFKKHKKQIKKSEIKKTGMFIDLIENELKQLSNDPSLIQGIIHPDIKPENILFNKGKLSGILDFDDIAHGYLLDNLAITLVWWCFPKNKLNKQFYQSLIQGYLKEYSRIKKEVDLLPNRLKIVLLFGILGWCHKVAHKPKIAYQGAQNFYTIYKNLKF